VKSSPVREFRAGACREAQYSGLRNRFWIVIAFGLMLRVVGENHLSCFRNTKVSTGNNIDFRQPRDLRDRLRDSELHRVKMYILSIIFSCSPWISGPRRNEPTILQVSIAFAVTSKTRVLQNIVCRLQYLCRTLLLTELSATERLKFSQWTLIRAAFLTDLPPAC
jgi:hypothetical protein